MRAQSSLLGARLCRRGGRSTEAHQPLRPSPRAAAPSRSGRGRAPASRADTRGGARLTLGTWAPGRPRRACRRFADSSFIHWQAADAQAPR